MSGFSNKPKILRGAFVEYGLNFPPLFVAFQFNPVELTRSRKLTFAPPNELAGESSGQSDSAGDLSLLREYHLGHSLGAIKKEQRVSVEEESIEFDIRLDATDQLNEGSEIAQFFGVGPQLAVLEKMAYPKPPGLLAALSSMISAKKGHSFSMRDNPPMILFIWGRKKVLPVNINSMKIKETEFSTYLNPIRAEVSVSLSVIEGKNTPYKYSQAMSDFVAKFNLANLSKLTSVMIPG